MNNTVCDYLTLTVHHTSYAVIDALNIVLVSNGFLKGMQCVTSESRFPFHTQETYGEYGELTVRYSWDYTTFDVRGKWFEKNSIEKLQREFFDVIIPVLPDKVKIARIDLKRDFTEYNTSYNPCGLEVMRYYVGKGDPTYYYGTTNNMWRVYDKKQEYLDVDKIEVEDPITRFEWQNRNIYVNKLSLMDFDGFCKKLFSNELEKQFLIESEYSKKRLCTRFQNKEFYNLSFLKQYANTIDIFIDEYGIEAFLSFIKENVNRNTYDVTKQKYTKLKRNWQDEFK